MLEQFEDFCFLYDMGSAKLIHFELTVSTGRVSSHLTMRVIIGVYHPASPAGQYCKANEGKKVYNNNNLNLMNRRTILAVIVKATYCIKEAA